VTLRHYPDRNVQMEIAGVLIIQGKNRYGGTFFVGRVDHGMTQAIPSADARMMCRGRHTSECSEPVEDRRVLARWYTERGTNCKPLCMLNWQSKPVEGYLLQTQDPLPSLRVRPPVIFFFHDLALVGVKK
jgi:hypothetical protein